MNLYKNKSASEKLTSSYFVTWRARGYIMNIYISFSVYIYIYLLSLLRQRGLLIILTSGVYFCSRDMNFTKVNLFFPYKQNQV